MHLIRTMSRETRRKKEEKEIYLQETHVSLQMSNASELLTSTLFPSKTEKSNANLMSH